MVQMILETSGPRLVLFGDFDFVETGDLRESLQHMTGPNTSVDLRLARYIGATAVGLLVRYNNAQRANSSRVVFILAPASRPAKIFHLLGLVQVLNITWKAAELGHFELPTRFALN